MAGTKSPKERHHEQDMDFEIRFFEGILKKKSDFVEALAALGDLYTRRGRFEEGLAIDRRLAELKPQDPAVLYNLSCSLSLTGNVEMAFSTLQKAIACGYDDFVHLERDDDLKALRDDARFKEFLTRMKAAKSRPRKE